MRNKIESIDIFCEVIDNFGDIGVVYRLARELNKKYEKTLKIRVILDRTFELTQLNKEAKEIEFQVLEGIEYMTYEFIERGIKENNFFPNKVIIEAFGCKIPDSYMKLTFETSSLIINLEYLSCEKWTVDFHGQESFLGSKTLKKYFFVPGLLEKIGGVILNKESLDGKQVLRKYFPNLTEEFFKDKFLITVFSYEKNFTPLFKELEKQEKESVLLLMGEKTQKSVELLLKNFKLEKIHLINFPFVNQEEYDSILKITDFNLVRGEDSFVRGATSGTPFLWHAYLQEEKIHLEKVAGFLSCYKDYFQAYHGKKYEKELEVLEKIFLDYNDRDSNSLELGKENYRDYFNGLTKLREMSKIYREYIMEKCNLIEKLSLFMESKLK